LNGTSIGFQHFSKKMLHNYCSMWDSVFLFASSPPKTNNRYNVFLVIARLWDSVFPVCFKSSKNKWSVQCVLGFQHFS
jgi:hypothetical protein